MPQCRKIAPILPEAVRIFKRDNLWHFSADTTASLLNISLGSLKLRVVRLAKKAGLTRGFSTTIPSQLFKDIPVFYGDWSTKGVGYGQVDTVVHSGPKLMGIMAYTVNFVDVATYWQEPVAQLNKGELATKVGMERIRTRLPFPLIGIHPDSGSEFINYSLASWCRKNKVEMTRSRPSKKNDNCYIEQRNNVIVRKYIGYERYDCKETVTILNEIYDQLRLYINFFQPTFKLLKKQHLPNGRWRRLYDTPKTPYQRVLERDDIPLRVKITLTRKYEQLNPKQLLATIESLTIKLNRTQKELGYHFE